MADYIPEEVFTEILRFLRPANSLALWLMMEHGMRIGDCLSQRWDVWDAWRRKEIPCVGYEKEKTGKTRLIWPNDYDLGRLDAIRVPGSPWLFPGRDPAKHRTRQAVWKDLHEVTKLYRVDGKKLCRKISTHTARKVYAVRLYHSGIARGEVDPLAIVQKDLNHADRAVTFLYALADMITASRVGEKM